MADEFLLVVITGMITTMLLLIIQLAISKFKDTSDHRTVARYLILLIILIIITAEFIGAFYYALQAGYDPFHLAVAFLFLFSGIACFLLVILDRYLEKKEKQANS